MYIICIYATFYVIGTFKTFHILTFNPCNSHKRLCIIILILQMRKLRYRGPRNLLNISQV